MATASQQTHAVHTPNSDLPSSDHDLLWEGDKMFNIYIWDYCTKRGYTNTARELAEEAKLQPNPRPPIDAKQGLLYEWWSVFWVLFSAKSNNSGSEDAMVYIQHHMAQARMQAQSALPRYPNGVRALPPGAPGMPPGAPPAPGSAGTAVTTPGGPAAHAQPHPGQSHTLNANTNAHPMPNGIGPGPPSAASQQQPHQPHQQGPQGPQGQPGQPQGPQQGPQQQQPQQQAPPLGFPAHAPHPQPNGIPQGMRPPLPGQQHQRAPGSLMGPFQSPTMAHPGPPPPYSLASAQQHMGTLPQQGMYPQMRAMMPPGSAPGAGGLPNGIAGAGGGSPGYLQQANPGAGSRAPTPGQGQGQGQGGPGQGQGLTQPSPSLANRTVPQTPPSFGQGAGMPMPMPGGGGRGPPFDQMNADMQKIDPQTMNELKAELGLTGKDVLAMNFDEKSRLMSLFGRRNAAGPSNQANANARNQQGRGSKRNSVSPGDEVWAHSAFPPAPHSTQSTHAFARPQQHEGPLKGESSPPAQKRARRSPDQPAPPGVPGGPGGAPNPGPGPNAMVGMYQPGPGGMMPNGMQRGPPFTPQMGMMMHPGGMVTPQMPQQMTQQLTQMQFQAKNPAYHGNMQVMHKLGPADTPQPPFGPDANQPRSAPPLFAPGAGGPPTGRPGPGPGQQQNKPGVGMMPPPSSPATNGAGKPPSQQQQQQQQHQQQQHQQQQQQQQGGSGKVEGKTDSSPRSGPPQPPGSAGTSGPSPATPAPGSGPGQTGAPSPSLANQPRPATATSNPPATTPQSAPVPPASAPPAPPAPDSLAAGGFDFMSTGFDDFTSMFGREDELFSDRDFGSWFNSDLGMLDASK
ncbi:hypothetical protein DFH11DRAFT_1730012 [Phellopilus nigrolimitatus]|nr:hypothetical protein DFH11DRAFT_1730012 [Phellopilus nigrolimitatus]